jgi:hypothetical protein
LNTKSSKHKKKQHKYLSWNLFLYYLHKYVIILHTYMPLYTMVYTACRILLSSDTVQKGQMKSMKITKQVKQRLESQTLSNYAIRSVYPRLNTWRLDWKSKLRKWDTRNIKDDYIVQISFFRWKKGQKFVDASVIVMSRNLVKSNDPMGQGIEVYKEAV